MRIQDLWPHIWAVAVRGGDRSQRPIIDYGTVSVDVILIIIDLSSSINPDDWLAFFECGGTVKINLHLFVINQYSSGVCLQENF